MPHLHDEKMVDADNAPGASVCSKSVESGAETVCPVAENAANSLLSLAALAEQHGKSSAPPQKDETEALQQVGADAPSISPSLSVAERPSFEEQRHNPPLSPGMGPRWGVVSQHSRFHGYVRQAAMPRMYPSPLGGPHPGSPMAEHPVQYMRRGSRGGFPMWTASPRPPYHPPPIHGACPSPLPSSFRGPVVQQYMNRQSSSNDDESCGSSGGRGAAVKRVSLGYPTKSILKKPRVETPLAATSSEGSSSPGEEGDTVETTRLLTRFGLSKTVSTSTDGGTCSEDGEEAQTKTTIDSVVVGKSAIPAEDAGVGRQRIISPASSNEYPKTDHHDEFAFGREGILTPEQRSRIFSHESPPGYYRSVPPFRMRPPHPPVQGMHCGPHRPGGPFMAPPVPMYAHHSMRPFPPRAMPAGSGPGMYPARNMSARGRPGFAAMPLFYARTRMDAPPTPTPASPRQVRGEITVDKAPQPPLSASTLASGTTGPSVTAGALEALNDVSGSVKRCVPLTPPVPSKYWSDADIAKDVVLPDFHRLVNFPDLLAKGRNAGDSNGESGAPNALCGKKRCVMCGQLRVSATYVRAKKLGTEEPGESTNDTGMTGTGATHIIPRQNKGVCTACDVTVWVALELDGLEIKWCKGCKNFRPWMHFGDKSLATKCLRCRDRQKEKYAMQKNASRRRSADAVEEKKSGDEHDLHQCTSLAVAANGLRSLMHAA